MPPKAAPSRLLPSLSSYPTAPPGLLQQQFQQQQQFQAQQLQAQQIPPGSQPGQVPAPSQLLQRRGSVHTGAAAPGSAVGIQVSGGAPAASGARNPLRLLPRHRGPGLGPGASVSGPAGPPEPVESEDTQAGRCCPRRFPALLIASLPSCPTVSLRHPPPPPPHAHLPVRSQAEHAYARTTLPVSQQPRLALRRRPDVRARRRRAHPCRGSGRGGGGRFAGPVGLLLERSGWGGVCAVGPRLRLGPLLALGCLGSWDRGGRGDGAGGGREVRAAAGRDPATAEVRYRWAHDVGLVPRRQQWVRKRTGGSWLPVHKP